MLIILADLWGGEVGVWEHRLNGQRQLKTAVVFEES